MWYYKRWNKAVRQNATLCKQCGMPEFQEGSDAMYHKIQTKGRHGLIIASIMLISLALANIILLFLWIFRKRKKKQKRK